MEDDFYKEVSKIEGIKIYKNVSIKNDNHMRIDATYLYKVEVSNYKNIKKLFILIDKYKLKYHIIGMGSNVLFVKDYYDFVLVKLLPIESKYNNILYAGSSINYLNNNFINLGITSLNFLTGVPSSVGGAIYMNAGAYNREMKDIIEYVHYMDLNTYKTKVFSNKDCNFTYRNSYFKHHKGIILSAKIKLIVKDKKIAKEEYRNFISIREKKMPLEYPNLGSIFKNLDGQYIGKMIEEIGIKGLSINGAKISEKHANVIINYNQTKGKDVLKLIEIIEDLVYIKYKTKIEREIIIFK